MTIFTTAIIITVPVVILVLPIASLSPAVLSKTPVSILAKTAVRILIKAATKTLPTIGAIAIAVFTTVVSSVSFSVTAAVVPVSISTPVVVPIAIVVPIVITPARPVSTVVLMFYVARPLRANMSETLLDR